VEPWWVPVLVAVIGGPIVALIEKFRRENKRDHGSVMDRLDLISSEIRHDIRQVRGDLTSHINGPAHGGTTPPAKMPRKRTPKAS
jgi:hypothetical protein